MGKKPEFEYGWKEGSRVKADAVEVYESFQKLKEKEGTILPASIVREARKKTHPLHECFEWNDTKAAGLYREEQARSIIRSLVVRVVGREDVEPIRAVVNVVSHSDDAYYDFTEEVMANEMTREMMIQRALSELRAFQRKYKDLKEFAKVFDAIGKVKV